MAMATQLRNWAAMAFVFGMWQVGLQPAVAQTPKTPEESQRPPQQKTKTPEQVRKIPEPLIGDLGADGFAVREKAHEELSEWALRQPATAIPELRRQMEDAEDPEVRARCFEILKQVVMEREYRGEGYLGIAMQEIEVKVPGDAKPRRGLTITLLMEGTAADLGGLKVGDLIVGIDEQVWRDEGMRNDFPAFIRNVRPGKVIEVKLLEDGKIVPKKVTLGEKPAGVNPSSIEDLDAANQAARELFFRRWLDKQEAVPR